MPNQTYTDYFQDYQRSVTTPTPQKNPWYSFIVRNFTQPTTDRLTKIEHEVYSYGDYFQTQAKMMDSAIETEEKAYANCLVLKNRMTQLKADIAYLKNTLAQIKPQDNKRFSPEEIHADILALHLEIKKTSDELKTNLALLANKIISNNPSLNDHPDAAESIADYLKKRINFYAKQDSTHPHTFRQYINPTTDYFHLQRIALKSCRAARYEASQTLEDARYSMKQRQSELSENPNWSEKKKLETHREIAQLIADRLALIDKIDSLDAEILKLNQVPNPTFRSPNILNRWQASYPTNQLTILGDALFRLPAEGMTRGIDALAGNAKNNLAVRVLKVAVSIVPLALSLFTHTVAKVFGGIWNGTIGRFIDYCLEDKPKTPAVSSQIKKISASSSPEEKPHVPVELKSPARSYLAPYDPNQDREQREAVSPHRAFVDVKSTNAIAAHLSVASNAQSNEGRAIEMQILTAEHAQEENVLSARSARSSVDLREVGTKELGEIGKIRGAYLIDPHTLPITPGSRMERSGSVTFSDARSPHSPQPASGAASPLPIRFKEKTHEKKQTVYKFDPDQVARGLNAFAGEKPDDKTEILVTPNAAANKKS